MSAFMMSELDFVVIFKGLTTAIPKGNAASGITEETAFNLVKEWELDNARSIEHRYSNHGEKASDLVSLQNLTLEQFKENYAEELKTDVDIYTLTKMLDCLVYQSCEHWPEVGNVEHVCSLTFVRNTVGALVDKNSKEYADAPWGM